MNFLRMAISRSRTTFCIMLMVVFVGLYARSEIPVEMNPEVTVPIISVTIIHEGISPEDGVRLIAKPMEQELRVLENVTELKSFSAENVVTMIVEFDVNVDIDQAEVDVREAVDRARSEIPDSSEEPIVKEIAATNPVMIISLTGDKVPARVLHKLGNQLKDQLEAIPDIREATLAGIQEEVLEAIVDPARLESYSVTHQELLNAVLSNNRLIPAGALDTGVGRFSIKVPGLIESREQVFDLPIKANSDGVVTLADIADIRRTFKDPESYTTSSGKPAVSLELWMRYGGNEVALAGQIEAVVSAAQTNFPEGVTVDYNFNQVPFTLQMVTELQGNIVTAMALVMVIIVGALGMRSGLLVGLGVPVSLLFALTIIHAIGYSLNFMVMFGMLLALGMLIDGSIVITEFADRKMAEGMSNRDAYMLSVQRMFWPVLASTATTLAAFLPLILWPGVSGDFMRYLPVSVFSVLAGSLLYALLFAPVIGALFGKPGVMDDKTLAYYQMLESSRVTELSGVTGAYARALQKVLAAPASMLALIAVLLVLIMVAYGRFGAGVTFFTETQPSHATGSVQARGNLSVEEVRALVSEVETTLLNIDGIALVYARATVGSRAADGATPGRRRPTALRRSGHDRPTRRRLHAPARPPRTAYHRRHHHGLHRAAGAPPECGRSRRSGAGALRRPAGRQVSGNQPHDSRAP